MEVGAAGNGLSNSIDNDLAELRSILKGVTIDNIINHDKINELKHWCESIRALHCTEPYKSIVERVEDALSDNILTRDEYDGILWVCDSAIKNSSVVNAYLVQELQSAINYLLSENVVGDKKFIKLKNWITDNSFLTGTYPYSEIKVIVVDIINNGQITKVESDILTTFITAFMKSRITLESYEDEFALIVKKFGTNGVFSPEFDLTMKNKKFCFTGKSNRGSRDEIADIICSNGGIYSNAVTRHTDYLICGSDGSPAWIYESYGRKVEYAMNLRKMGANIAIIHEDEFWGVALSGPQLLSDTSEIGAHSSYSLEQAVELLEAHIPIPAQIILKDFLYTRLYDNIHSSAYIDPDKSFETLIQYGIFDVKNDESFLITLLKRNQLQNRIALVSDLPFKKNTSKDALIDWCHENIPDCISRLCKGVYYAELNSAFTRYMRGIYTYLHRKLDDLSSFDNIFPNDAVTKLLNVYDHNRFDKWEGEYPFITAQKEALLSDGLTIEEVEQMFA